MLERNPIKALGRRLKIELARLAELWLSLGTTDLTPHCTHV
jgi:hypothetical protein